MKRACLPMSCGLFISALLLGGCGPSEDEQRRAELQRQAREVAASKQAAAKQAAAEQRRREREAIELDWAARKPVLLKEAKRHLSRKKPADAINTLKTYAVLRDPEAAAVMRQAEEKLKAEAGKLARELFGKKLRTKYLDDGLDIKVHVTGADSTTLELTYPLFSDVWSHNLKKGDLLPTARTLGFRQVRMRDGYEWGVRWDLTAQ